MRKTTLTLLIVLIGGAALAQPGPRDWHGRPDLDRPPREMLEGFRLFKLTEELELTEEQTARVYPLIAEMNRVRDGHREAVHEKLRELRDLLDDKDVDERRAAELSLEIHAMRGEMAERHHEMQAELLGLLDELQKARYVLFEQMFDRHLRDVKERLHERFEQGDRRPQRRKD